MSGLLILSAMFLAKADSTDGSGGFFWKKPNKVGVSSRPFFLQIASKYYFVKLNIQN